MLPACRLHPGTSRDLAVITHQELHPGTNQDMTKFTEIRSSIQIHRNPHNSHASYDKIQHHHLRSKEAPLA
jgi:hypothetical protein